MVHTLAHGFSADIVGFSTIPNGLLLYMFSRKKMANQRRIERSTRCCDAHSTFSAVCSCLVSKEISTRLVIVMMGYLMMNSHPLNQFNHMLKPTHAIELYRRHFSLASSTSPSLVLPARKETTICKIRKGRNANIQYRKTRLGIDLIHSLTHSNHFPPSPVFFFFLSPSSPDETRVNLSESLPFDFDTRVWFHF